MRGRRGRIEATITWTVVMVIYSQLEDGPMTHDDDAHTTYLSFKS
jgi:hypothetical protein